MQRICPSCHCETIPDALFCDNCGTRLDTAEAIDLPAAPAEAPELTQTIPMSVPAVAVTKQPWYVIALGAACGVLLIAAVALLVLSLNLRQNLADESDLSTQQAMTISQLEREVTQLEDDKQQLTLDTETYRTLLSFLREPDAGFSSETFRSYRPVYIMKLSDEPATFTLTADFYGSVTVYWDTEGTACDVAPVKNSFYDTAPIRLTPQHEGITYITFSNSQNSKSFRVMVIVTE